MQMGQKGQNFEEDIRNRELMFQAMNQSWGSASNNPPMQHSSTCRTAHS